MARKKKQFQATVESLSSDGRGVVHTDSGRTVFVWDALPGEQITGVISRRKAKYAEGYVAERHSDSPMRIAPQCDHYDFCGGCVLQHLPAQEQLRTKQDLFIDTMGRLGKVDVPDMSPPLSGPAFGYRRRARWGARFSPGKGRAFVGFREKRSHFVTGTEVCHILSPPFNTLPPAMGELVGSLSVPDRVPQVELAAADNGAAIVIRHMFEITAEDGKHLAAFADTHNVQIWLQPKGEDTVHPFYPAEPEPLYYELPDFNLKLYFQPHDFIQVNAQVNRQMVSQAIEWLQLDPQDRVVDLFSGLGNFSLPIAQRCQRVHAADAGLRAVERGRFNAAQADLQNVDFHQIDLYTEHEQLWAQSFWQEHTPNKMLLDPPRSGAYELVQQIDRASSSLERIVYVSCNPATLARDARVLLDAGFELQKACVMDMFPHTGHIESMALFVKT